MLFRRTQPVHPAVAAASVAGLGTPISTPGSTLSRRKLPSEAIRHRHFHGEQHQQYRRVCYRLAFMAKYLLENSDVLGALRPPISLACGIALSLVQAFDGMFVNRQLCSELAELVTRHLCVLREELGDAAKEDAKFRSLIEDYAEILRVVTQGVALIAHRRRLRQLVHHHSESEELQNFKSKLDTASQAMMLRCGLQMRQMQGHVVTDQRRIVEDLQEHSYILAALNEKLEDALKKLDHIMVNRNNPGQFLQPFDAFFDDSRVKSTHSLASDPIEPPKPTTLVPILAFTTA